MPYGIGNALCLAVVQYFHKGLQGTQAAGKSAIGVGVYQHFLDFIHCHSAVQSAGKGNFQVLQVTTCCGRGDGYDVLLTDTQRVRLLCP